LWLEEVEAESVWIELVELDCEPSSAGDEERVRLEQLP